MNVDGIENKDIMRESNVDPQAVLLYTNIWIIEGRFGRETSAKYFLTSLGAKVYNNITIFEDALNII